MRKPERMAMGYFAIVTACATLTALDSSAQNYPAKPIHMLAGLTVASASDVAARLTAVIRKGISTPEAKKSFNSQGIEPQTNTPEQFAGYIKLEIARNFELINLTGAKAE